MSYVIRKIIFMISTFQTFTSQISDKHKMKLIYHYENELMQVDADSFLICQNIPCFLIFEKTYFHFYIIIQLTFALLSYARRSKAYITLKRKGT